MSLEKMTSKNIRASEAEGAAQVAVVGGVMQRLRETFLGCSEYVGLI